MKGEKSNLSYSKTGHRKSITKVNSKFSSLKQLVKKTLGSKLKGFVNRNIRRVQKSSTTFHTQLLLTIFSFSRWRNLF